MASNSVHWSPVFCSVTRDPIKAVLSGNAGFCWWYPTETTGHLNQNRNLRAARESAKCLKEHRDPGSNNGQRGRPASQGSPWRTYPYWGTICFGWCRETTLVLMPGTSKLHPTLPRPLAATITHCSGLCRNALTVNELGSDPWFVLPAHAWVGASDWPSPGHVLVLQLQGSGGSSWCSPACTMAGRTLPPTQVSTMTSPLHRKEVATERPY